MQSGMRRRAVRAVSAKPLVWRGVRWLVVPCVLGATLLGCRREEPSVAQTAQDSLVAVDSTPAFRNLGKRAEGKL